jgi:outer membrane protein OmpA-like peptidoglycan-associated protein
VISDASTARDRSEELEEALARFQSSASVPNAIVTLPDVLFDSGKATLSPGAKRNLDPLASYLRDESRGKIIVQGHADNTGTADQNMQLSLSRASAVKSYFVEKGVTEDRLFTLGLGANYPIVSNDTPEGRQRNRRVELIIERPGPQAPPASASQ